MFIIVSDIFGRTPALKKLCSDLSKKTEIIDPYNGKDLGFSNETEAYSYFMKHVGLRVYTTMVRKKVDNLSSNSILVGFSIGASAVWQISQNKIKNVSSLICFYGSQIRNSKDISPAIPLQLLMPKSEEHFSVDELSKELKPKNNVIIHQTDYFHGFMNSYSKNYNKTAYKKYIDWLKFQAG